tara:strand:+ start:398 stop:1960 length:1563 start_codon:yes stop_codon:yes gene_type:complete
VSKAYKKFALISAAIIRTLKSMGYWFRPLIQGLVTALYSRKSNSELTGDAAPIEIIEIETSDTSATVIGKIESSGLNSAFIELPENAYEFERLDHWLRIAAYARRTGFVPIIVSRNTRIRKSAKSTGLKTRTLPMEGFGDMLDSLLKPLKVGRVRSLSSNTLLTLVTTVTFGLTLLWIFNSVPRAEVRFNPPTTSRTIDTILTVTDIANGNDIANRRIVGIAVRREVSATVVVKTTGIDDSGDETSLVVLEFTNSSSKPYSLAKGFQVRTEDYLSFAIIEDVIVGPGEVVLVSALCGIAGEIGNVTADTLTIGILPTEIAVTNPEPAFGGTDNSWSIVSPDDVLQAHVHAQSVLRAKGIHELRDLNLGELISTTVATPVFSQQARQNIGDPSDIFVMDYVIIATGLVVSPDEARRVTRTIFSTTLSPAEELVRISQIELIDSPNLGKDKVRLRATAEVADLSHWIEDVNDFLPGKSTEQAEWFLWDRLDLIDSPDIQITPNFLRRTSLPRDPGKITLVLQ